MLYILCGSRSQNEQFRPQSHLFKSNSSNLFSMHSFIPIIALYEDNFLKILSDIFASQTELERLISVNRELKSLKIAN